MTRKKRPSSAHARTTKKPAPMTEERAKEILNESSPKLYNKYNNKNNNYDNMFKNNSRRKLPSSPLLKRRERKNNVRFKTKLSNNTVDDVSALARFEALRLHSLVDMPDLPTSILGARSQAIKLLEEMNEQIPKKKQQKPQLQRSHNRYPATRMTPNFADDDLPNNFPVLSALYSYDCTENITHLKMFNAINNLQQLEDNTIEKKNGNNMDNNSNNNNNNNNRNQEKRDNEDYKQKYNKNEGKNGGKNIQNTMDSSVTLSSFREEFETSIRYYNESLQIILSFYQKVTAQCASLCKERGEIMAKVFLSYMNLVKETYQNTCNILLKKMINGKKEQNRLNESQINQIIYWKSLATGLKETNVDLQGDADAAFLESNDFISATEHLITTVVTVSEKFKMDLLEQCRKTISRIMSKYTTRQLTNAETELYNEIEAIDEELVSLKNIKKGTHPASKCRNAADLIELLYTLLGRSIAIMNQAEQCGRKYLSTTEHGLKKNMDHVERLTTLSNGLKKQLAEQTIQLKDQEEELITSRQKISFYRADNNDMRKHIKELDRDLKMANTTIESYEHLLAGNKDNLRHVSVQTELVEKRIEKEKIDEDIDFVALASNPFKIDSNITMVEPKHKKYKKRRKSRSDHSHLSKASHQVEQLLEAEGTFFGALAQASKPPKRVFLKKGKKKTRDQHAVSLLKPDKLLKQILELIISKIKADDADDRMCLSRQNMTDYIYDYYLNQYGTFEIADKRVVSLMASVSTHRNVSPRVRAIERFCMLGPGPFLDDNVLNFYLLCWDNFLNLQGNNTHGSIWHSIERGDYEISQWIGISIAKRVIVKSTLNSDAMSEIGPFALRLQPVEIKATMEHIDALLPTTLDVFMDVLVAEYLKAGNRMEETLDKIYTEKAVKEKKKGLMINEFKSLLLEIDPTLPQVRITTMFRNGCKSSSSNEFMDRNAFKIFIRSSRRLLQYVKNDMDDIKRKKNAIFRKNKEDLLELQQEWNRSIVRIDNELLILAKCGCAVIGDDKYYNKAQRCKHAFMKALKAAIVVNDASIGWESYNHLLEALEQGMKSVSEKAIEEARKELEEQNEKEKIRKGGKPSMSRSNANNRSGDTKNYASTIRLGSSAMWTNMSTMNRARFNA